MEPKRDYIDARIVVKNLNTGINIADTFIIDYDEIKKIIGIQRSDLFAAPEDRVSALIISKYGLEECLCTVRESEFNHKLALAVYKRFEKKNRRDFKRYNVNISGIAQILESPVPNAFLQEDELIKILNMSASGILFETSNPVYHKDDILRIVTECKGHRLAILCQITRIVDTLAYPQYACKIISVEQNNP